MRGANDGHGSGAGWAGDAAAGVAAGYAVVSFSWAFGETAGIGTLGGRLEELAGNGDPVVRWLPGSPGC